MDITVQAVYEDGVLKPRTRLELDEHETVWVSIQRRTPLEAWEYYRGMLRADLTPEQAEALRHARLQDEDSPDE